MASKEPPAEKLSGQEGSLTASVAYRVTRVLELLATQPQGVSVRQAERLVGIDRSAISRILLQLSAIGFAVKEANSGLYHPGPSFFGMASAVRSQDTLWRAARPILQGLVDRFDETCYMTVRQDHRVVFQEKIECRQPVRYVIELGEPMRLTTGAAGLAILASLPEDEIDGVLAEPIPRYTPRTVTDPARLRAELDRFREQGYSVSVQRWTRDGGGIGVPFFDGESHCLGAIALSAPANRLDPERIAAIAPAVVEAGRQLSERLGATPSERVLIQ